ncbi:MAG TPA: hypothetical protein VMV56_12585 [Williamwhitmania sp.]|nr:hypothetical protein [Williamwhitmania sp.]
MENIKDIVFKFQGSPHYWREKAKELRYAAEILWPYSETRMNKIMTSIKENNDIDILSIEPDTFNTFLALIGFSTECLFKGTIIRDNPSFVSNGKLSSKLATHDLHKLASLAKIKLSTNEQIFCNQALEAMTVKFRYPISKVAEDAKTDLIMGEHCKTVFTDLFDRLYPTLGQIIANGRLIR